MARTKQIRPMQRIPSGEIMQEPPEEPLHHTTGYLQEPKPHSPGRTLEPTPAARPSQTRPDFNLLALIICIGGIYGSFLTWAVLQERIVKTPYAAVPRTLFPKSTDTAVEFWNFPIVLNTIQSVFAAISGSCYLLAKQGTLNVFTSRKVVWPILLVSVTTSLASPFGYASLAHVDYLTYVLAKSCKLVPVMVLHVGLFGRRYPVMKYVVVLAITAGVIVFTLSQSSKKGSSAKQAMDNKSKIVGLSLLGVNLLFDGLTNTVQDHIFAAKHHYGEMSGAKMMVASNIMATALTASYLLVTPLIPKAFIPAFLPLENTNELSAASQFLTAHPSVLQDVLGFAACGAIGQLFIYATLERFDSIVLVTVTLTRKMLTMLLSLAWFGKKLNMGQWGGVGLVVGGLATEAWMSRQEKARKKAVPADQDKKEL
jgi:UDP-galactose transporter B1